MIRQLVVVLIRPTKYDEDGYLVRHLRGVLPSNTLACLHALTLDVARRGALGPVRVRAWLCDESVEAVPFRRIERAARRHDTQVVVGLVGVQTNQMPRATDLALRFRDTGLPVLLGGFHVSGSFAMLPDVAEDVRRLSAAGVTLVTGEVEATWESILRDGLTGRLASSYDTLDARPVLDEAPVPRLDRRVLRRFVYRRFGTLETSRGCPFSCSFCTIINVQGRAMRSRDPATIGTALVDNFRTLGTTDYFFTDDDFARNPAWRSVLESMVRVREEHGIPVRFLMQADLLAHRIPGFIELARRAGCFQVFLGMESLDPESLADAGKRQNRTADYGALVQAWRAAGILVHVGYIIGFPSDSPESVRHAVHVLRDQIRPDLASFFMLTPLPGSQDHFRHVQAGTGLDSDWNRYDTTRPVLDHPRMSRAAWQSAYDEAWRFFYEPAAMRRQLASIAPDLRITLLQLYLWYKSAAELEGAHPMLSGVFRLKPRTDRRPGFAIESRLSHHARRIPEAWAMLRGYGTLLAELRDLWAATRGRERSWSRFLREMFGHSRDEDRTTQRPIAATTASPRHPNANASPIAS